MILRWLILLALASQVAEANLKWSVQGGKLIRTDLIWVEGSETKASTLHFLFQVQADGPIQMALTARQSKLIHSNSKAIRASLPVLEKYAAPRIIERLDPNPCYTSFLPDVHVKPSQKATVTSLAQEFSPIHPSSFKTVKNRYVLETNAQGKVAILLSLESKSSRTKIQNSDSPLIIHFLTRSGWMKPRSLKIPPLPILKPILIHSDWKASIPRAIALRAAEAPALEYVGNLSFCDFCTSERPSDLELKSLGVGWLESATEEELPRFVKRGWNRVKVKNPVAATLTRYLVGTGQMSEFEHAEGRIYRYLVFDNRREWSGSPRACQEARNYLAKLEERRQDLMRSFSKISGASHEELKKVLVPLPDLKRWWERFE